MFDQFANREGELLTGSVSRVEPRAIILDVGKGVEAILATSEQSPLEHYRIGQPVKAFVLEVRRSARGPQILVSRARTRASCAACSSSRSPRSTPARSRSRRSPARPAAARRSPSSSRQEGLDPVGATVGQRGARVQAVVAELAGEKIDVIPWNEDPSVFVANALSPGPGAGRQHRQEHRIANVTVPERMLSLAIGREGQNARLAARLTGWRIDIRSDVAAAEAAARPTARRRRRSPRTANGRAEAPAAAAADDAAAAAAAGRRAAPRRRRAGGRAAGNERARSRRAEPVEAAAAPAAEADEAARSDQDGEGRRAGRARHAATNGDRRGRARGGAVAAKPKRTRKTKQRGRRDEEVSS